MAAELGLDYEHVKIDFVRGGTRTPEYLAVNPNRYISAIGDDGFILWESMSINLYPAKKYSPGGLYPDGLEAEARAPQWSFRGMTEVEPPSRTAPLNRVGYPGRERPGDRGCGRARTRRSSRGVMWGQSWSAAQKDMPRRQRSFSNDTKVSLPRRIIHPFRI